MKVSRLTYNNSKVGIVMKNRYNDRRPECRFVVSVVRRNNKLAFIF